MIIGRKDKFAFEVGDFSEQSYRLRMVDIWAGGTRLCVDDNTAFVDQFTYALSFQPNKTYLVSEYRDLLSGLTPVEMAEFVISTRDRNTPNFEIHDDQIYQTYRFLDLGPTTDNLTIFLFRTDDSADLVWSFSRQAEIEEIKEEYKTAQMNFDEVMDICRSTVEHLNKEQKKAEPGSSYNSGQSLRD